MFDSRWADAISSIESGGQYGILGPVTKSGDRAYGKYQVMGQNVGPWTKEVLGQSLTPQQFLASPQAQDAVFQGKFGQYVNRYGNPQDAASAWFTGRPLAQGANKSDLYGTTGSSYVAKFNQALGNPQTAQPQATPQAAPTQTAQLNSPFAMPQLPSVPSLGSQSPQVSQPSTGLLGQQMAMPMMRPRVNLAGLLGLLSPDAPPALRGLLQG